MSGHCCFSILILSIAAGTATAAAVAAAPLVQASSLVTPTLTGSVGPPTPFDSEPPFEWTALGDSYASGVGSGNYVDGGRCLRYDRSYAGTMNLNPESVAPGLDLVFPPRAQRPRIFNYLACAGAEIQQIIDWQLLDAPQGSGPNWQFNPRPAFGNAPELATLTAGGDDIDFPGIIFNCILGTHVSGGPPQRTCADQRAYTRALLDGNQWKDDLSKLIDAVFQKGHGKNADFKLFVTGYAKFFNSETTGADTNCDSISLNVYSLLSNWKPMLENGPDDSKLTVALRREFNQMADDLNKGIQDTVNAYASSHGANVKFVDIETDFQGRDLLAGHRMCEKGVYEPDRSNPRAYIFHFPYTNRGEEPDALDAATFNRIGGQFEQAWNKTISAAGSNVTAAYPTWNRFLDAVLNNTDGFNNNPDDQKAAFADFLGLMVKTFHPKLVWNTIISQLVFLHYVIDQGESASDAVMTMLSGDAKLEAISRLVNSTMS